MNPLLPSPVRIKDRSRQAGFSLMELMVSLPATLIMTLALGGVIIAIYAMSSRTVTNVTAENELNLMVNTLRSATRSGINIRYYGGGNAGLRNTRSSAQEGYMHGNFNYSRFSHLTTTSAPLMYFARETANGTVSRPRPTALFFVPPTPTTPGQLQLTMLNNNAGPVTMRPCPVTGTCTVPNPPSIFLNNVVGLRTFDPQYSPNLRMIDSVKMEITLRVFVTGSDKPKMYCPAGDWGSSCSAGGPYRDFTRTIVLQFDNNRRESLMAGFDFPFGLYFFKPTGPRWLVE